tara:strand:+ start:2099 stop:4057 length:1959 start_codon:yes stop_codon:yes gene_type:complete
MGKLIFRDATDKDTLVSEVQTGDLMFRDATDEEIVDLDSDLPDPLDDTQTRDLTARPSVFSATKFLTEPSRDIIQPMGQGYASTALRGAGAGSVTQALLGLPVDAVQNLLGAAGTGFMAAASVPAEIYGLLGANSMEKRRLARGLGGMVESIPFNAPVSSLKNPATVDRMIGQQNAKIIAKEAQELGVIPPAKNLGPTTAGIAGALEELPIVGSRLDDETQRVAQEISEVVGRVSPETSASPYTVGQKLKKGVDDFVGTTQKKQDELYDRVDELIPPETKFEAEKTVELLDELAEAWKGFKSAAVATGDSAVIKFLDDLTDLGPIGKAKVAAKEAGDTEALKLLGSFADDTELKPQSYGALKRLRTSIMESLKSQDPLSKTIGAGTLKRLSKSLTEDMETAVASQGPDAQKAYELANRYYKKRKSRIDGAITDIYNAENPEKAIDIFIKTATEGSATESQKSLIKLQNSLSKDEFSELSESILGRMGRFKAGEKSVPEGDVPFDPMKWVNDYEKLSPYARKQLSDTVGGKGTAEEMTKLSRYIRLVAGEQNPRLYRFRRALTSLGFFATTAASGLAGFGAGGGGGAVAGLAGGALGLALSAEATSRLLTNKKFLSAMNRMAVNDIGPMRALALSKDNSSIAARAILQSEEKE